MKGFIDLSCTIENGMPVHPFDSEVKLYQDRFLEKNKYNNSRLETGMHAGTHIDIPRHLFAFCNKNR
ncbi:putative cyclase [Natranaerovirga pectinivora]|uniref:Putative cyclase n=1 Tax=Natranaerovirga pectinivora TaxID=682400 RepID=A0A4V2V0F3_9FIRM|nr:cyclase family protein [Natranaerovirga pectinivora]TCT15630.1 putative cyclase [Natranaerovirga pectinivora]